MWSLLVALLHISVAFAGVKSDHPSADVAAPPGNDREDDIEKALKVEIIISRSRGKSLHGRIRVLDIERKPNHAAAKDTKGQTSAPSPSVQTPKAGIELEGMDVLCVVSKNIGLIKDKIAHTDPVGKVRDVLIYRDENNGLVDYWGVLKFREENGTYVDETGYYEGSMAENVKQVLEKGRLTKNGFYQLKEISDQEVDAGFRSTQGLIAKIAAEKGLSVQDLKNDQCELSAVDKLLFARAYAGHTTP